MATHAPLPRVPFAPLDNSRLKHLASAKNRQNGHLSMAKSNLDIKANAALPSKTTSIFSPPKRSFESSTFDDFDGENVDPASLCSPSKKSKNDVLQKPFNPFTFSPSKQSSMPPPSTIPSRLTATPVRANMSSPRAPFTAPAGRSPKRKISTPLNNKTRRISAPFSRIDPPFSISSRTTNDASLPFSLDAALNGTFSKSSAVAAAPKHARSGSGATIQESMPRNWFFDIYEDTPEEEAANLMEHSTLTLDLSSDEESGLKAKDDRGKENTPPEGYDAPTASRPTVSTAAAPVAGPTRVKKVDIIRKKVVVDDMDDGQRSPLSDLETEYFIPEGLDKDSHVVVDATPEKSSASSTVDMSNLFAAPLPFTAGSGKKARATSTPSKRGLFDLPVVSADGDVKGDIIVWEDSPASVRSMSPFPASEPLGASTKGEVADENTRP